MKKYDNTYKDRFCEALEQGYGRIQAAKKAGIAFQSFLNWIGEDLEFLERVKKAEAIGSIQKRELAINSVLRGFEKSWQAGAWWLERNYPEEFAKKDNIDKEDVNFDKNITINVINASSTNPDKPIRSAK